MASNRPCPRYGEDRHATEGSASCNTADQPLPTHHSYTLHPGAVPLGRILQHTQPCRLVQDLLLLIFCHRYHRDAGSASKTVATYAGKHHGGTGHQRSGKILHPPQPLQDSEHLHCHSTAHSHVHLHLQRYQREQLWIPRRRHRRRHRRACSRVVA